jgi:sugar lactone lactonase YvrE
LQRLLVVCAVALVVLAVFAADRNRMVAAAAATQGPTDTTSITSASKMRVIATGISVRAIAVALSNSAATVYLTNASAPNQVFEIGTATPAMPTANAVVAVAGTGAVGSLGDGGAAISAQLDLNEGSLIERSAIALATDGTIYVADTGNSTIRVIAGSASTEPGVIRSAAGRWAGQNVALTEPMGVATDRAGDLFITDHAAGTVDLLTANSQMNVLAHVTSPASIAATPDGATVFVASPETGAVFAIRTQTREINAVSGFAPASSSSTPACQASSAGVQQVCPAGVATDAAGNLFVSDSNSGRILRVDAKTSATSTVASGLNQPGALAIDASGNLYVAEQGAARIVAFAQVGTSQGSLSLAPTSAAYGNEPSGGETATQSFTVSNISASAIAGLSIPKATTPADFTVQANSCTTTLAANSSCTLSIAFTPTATGARSDTLTVTDSNPADSASTALSGTGDDYQLQLANGQLMSVSVQAGAAATFNLQVVPDNAFSGTVTLVCPGNLPTNTTCAFSSPTVNVTPGTPAAFSVTFQTTGIINPFQPAALPGGIPPNWRFPAVLLIATMIVLFCVSRWRNLLVVTSFGLLAFALLLFGCSKGRSQASVGATPAGTSTMTVTGNSQDASRAVTITLNVVQE